MKSFIYRLIFSILIFITIFFLFDFLSTRLIVSNSDFKLSSNPKYIVLGHSHPECAFDDSLISNFSNLSHSGESYFYTFQKIEEVLKQNKSITTIFVEFSNNQVDEKMNDWIWGDKFIDYRYPIYSSFMSFDDNFLLIKNNFKGFYNAYSISNKNKFLRIFEKDFNFKDEIGGYRDLRGTKIDSLLKNIHNSSANPTEISEYNLLYLEKIINLSQKNNTRIILIRTPKHKNYTGYYNETVYKEVLNTRFKNIEYLDLAKFPLMDDEFKDLEHLNYKGARKLSLWFDALLRSNVLDETVNQKNINKMMKEVNLNKI